MTRFEIGRVYGRWQCQAWVERESYEDRGVYVWVNIDSGVTVEGVQHPEPDTIRGATSRPADPQPTRRRRRRVLLRRPAAYTLLLYLAPMRHRLAQYPESGLRAMLEKLKTEARYVYDLSRQPLFSRESLINSLSLVPVFALASTIAQRWLDMLQASVL